jgi:hypothetical protein
LAKLVYRFEFPDGHEESLEVGAPLKQGSDADLPAWTELGFQQCDNCPLSTSEVPRCPMAVRLVPLVDLFGKVRSYEEVSAKVESEERTVTKRTTVQRVLRSLMGLLSATSDCPHVAFLKPMAHFHLPFSSAEETIYRVASMYLLAQYFLKKDGKEDDTELKGLTQIYSNLRLLNRAIADRLRGATHTDSSLNAIVLLDMLASAVPFVIEEQLEDVRHLFAPYFSEYYNSLVINPVRSK